VRTLGWGTPEHQRRRFSVLTATVDMSGKSVVDFGCGFGDLFGFLGETGIDVASYTGLDINPDLVRIARETYPAADYPNTRFAVSELDRPEPIENCAEVVIMLGVLNFRLSEMDNREFARLMLERAFSLSTEYLVCDFLSAELTPDYSPEDFVFYYDPGEVVSWGLELSPSVALRHDYPPIPQREMLLVVRK